MPDRPPILDYRTPVAPRWRRLVIDTVRGKWITLVEKSDVFIEPLCRAMSLFGVAWLAFQLIFFTWVALRGS